VFQIIGGVCMILFGAGLVAIGLSLPMFGYAIVGGVLVAAGIFLLVSFWRTRGNMPHPR
jgi:membrane protein implicated in regulation of membrane protease activity